MSQGNQVEARSEWAIRAASPSAVCQAQSLAVGPRSRTGKLRGRGLSSSQRDMAALGLEGPPVWWGSQTAGCWETRPTVFVQLLVWRRRPNQDLVSLELTHALLSSQSLLTQ